MENKDILPAALAITMAVTSCKVLPNKSPETINNQTTPNTASVNTLQEIPSDEDSSVSSINYVEKEEQDEKTDRKVKRV